MKFEKIIKATIPTISPRPPCWFRLVEKLIAEGFVCDHSTAEWFKGDWRGRISFTETKAWLRHRHTKSSRGIVTSHETE